MSIKPYETKNFTMREKAALSADIGLDVLENISRNKRMYGDYTDIMRSNAMINTAKELNSLGFEFDSVEIDFEGEGRKTLPINQEEDTSYTPLTIEKLINLSTRGKDSNGV
jgi:hypothetical protein